jgi:HAMP domain-containing protein
MKAVLLRGLLCLGFLLTPAVWAQSDSRDQALNVSHEIVMQISRGRFEEAWQAVKSSSSIPDERIDQFAKEYDSHYVRSIVNFGPSTGVELISQDMLGKSMLRITYLVKYEVTGVAWFLYYYRVGDKWVLSEFNYDLNNSSLFKTAGGGNTGYSGGNLDLVLGDWKHKIEKRLKALEGRPAGGSAQTLDLSNVNMGSTEMALLNLIERRLSEIEQLYEESNTKVARIEESNEDILKRLEETDVYALEQEVARLRRLVRVLVEQHPYAEFPRF